jgi:hypothetical protein
MRVFMTTVFLLMTLSACSLTQPSEGQPVAQAPQLKVGDSWTYRVTNGFNNLPRGDWSWKITAIDGARIETRISDGNNPNRFGAVYEGPWNIISRALPDGSNYAFSPPLISFNFPLSPGQNWSQNTAATELATGKVFNWRITTKVYGWERVKTPAGEFNALKIVRYLNLSDDNWWRMETRLIESDWYAPEVKAIVRRETQGEYIVRGSSNRNVRRTDRAVWELILYTPG